MKYGKYGRGLQYICVYFILCLFGLGRPREMSNYGVTTTKNSKKREKTSFLFFSIYLQTHAGPDRKWNLIRRHQFPVDDCSNSFPPPPIDCYSFYPALDKYFSSFFLFQKCFIQPRIGLSHPKSFHVPCVILFSRIYHMSSVSNCVSYACLLFHHQLCHPIMYYLDLPHCDFIPSQIVISFFVRF